MKDEVEVKLMAITKNAEKLIERAGRTCYDSIHLPPSEKNKLTADQLILFKTKDTPSFIQMLIKNGHLSVLEHAQATFKIRNVSRALTHQLVRHRVASYSQRSQRYVSEKSFPYVTPPAISKNEEALKVFEKAIRNTKTAYQELISLGIKREDARFVLPNATVTEIVMTANFREWRHVVELRGHRSAQWEIRRLAVAVLKILKEKAPATFGDFEIDENDFVITRSDSAGGSERG